MKKLHSLVLACVGLVSIASYSTAYSQNREGAATFTVGGGYQHFSSRRHIKNTGIPFGAVGYDITDQWGVEGLFGFFTTDQKGAGGVQVDGNLFAIDGLFYFPPYRMLQPYVLAGIGVTRLNPNGTDAHNEGNINAGIGAEYFIDSAVAFRLEARDLYTMVGGKNDVFLDGGVTFFWDLC